MFGELEAIIKAVIEEEAEKKLLKVKQEINRYIHQQEGTEPDELSDTARRCLLLWEKQKCLPKQPKE